jgi:hypothetical protein
MASVLLPAGVAFSLGGNANYTAATNEIRLTSNGQFLSGAAMSHARIDLRQDFNISFDVFLGSSDAGADGLGFVLHNSPDGAAAIGAGGRGLAFEGIQNGLAIEFDTWFTADTAAGTDIDNDHTNFIDTDGSFGSTPFDLGNIEDGQWHSVEVTWDASTQTLSYTFDGQQAGVLNGDIAAQYLGGSDFAHFGFTAATGGAINEHKVRVSEIDATFEGVINSAPVALDDTAATSADTSVAIDVLANDTDADGDALSVQGFGQASNGTVVENPDGTLSYTPDAGFSGTDNFTYTVTDGIDEDAPATVTVTVSLDDPFA